MLEKELEKKLVKGIRDLRGKAYKFTSPNNAGVPDRLVVLPTGEVFFVELKTDIGKLSTIQSYQIRELRKLKQRVFILKGSQELENFLAFIERRVKEK